MTPDKSRRVYRPAAASASEARDGGRAWWAHVTFTRMNIAPTILEEDFEELMNVQGIGEKSFLKLKPQITIANIPAGNTSQQK